MMDSFSLQPLSVADSIGSGIAVSGMGGAVAMDQSSMDQSLFADYLAGQSLSNKASSPVFADLFAPKIQTQANPIEGEAEKLEPNAQQWLDQMSLVLQSLGLNLPKPEQMLEVAPQIEQGLKDLLVSVQNGTMNADQFSAKFQQVLGNLGVEFSQAAPSVQNQPLEDVQIKTENQTSPVQLTPSLVVNSESENQNAIVPKLAAEKLESSQIPVSLGVPKQSEQIPLILQSLSVGTDEIGEIENIDPSNPTLSFVSQQNKSAQNLELQSQIQNFQDLKPVQNQVQGVPLAVEAKPQVLVQLVQQLKDLGVLDASKALGSEIKNVPSESLKSLSMMPTLSENSMNTALVQPVEPKASLFHTTDFAQANTASPMPNSLLGASVNPGPQVADQSQALQENSLAETTIPSDERSTSSQKFEMASAESPRANPVEDKMLSSALSFETSKSTSSELEGKVAKTDYVMDHKSKTDLPLPPVQQVVRQVNVQIGAGVQSMRLILNPEHLGGVEVEVNVEGDRVQVALSVDNDEARKILEKDLVNLRHSMESQNLKLDKVELTVNPDQQNKHNSQSYADAREQQNERNARHHAKQQQQNSQPEQKNTEENPRQHRYYGYNRVEYTA